MEKNMTNEENRPRKPRRGRQRNRREIIKRRLKRLGIILILLAVLALIFVFAFRIKNVNVTGNSRYTKDEILQMIKYDEQSQNTIIFYMENRRLQVEGIPFIDAIHIEMGGRDTINIEVVEKVLIGCIEDHGQYAYFDTDGMICEIEAERQSDVPLIEGLEYKALEQNQVLTVEDKSVYNALLNLTLLLNKHTITVERVIFKEDGSMSLDLNNIQVLLGYSENLEDKISELKNLLPKLESYRGTLHLENYDSTKDSIIFTKE